MNNLSSLFAAAAFLATASSANAQTQQNDQQSRQQERINSIFGALFGDRSNSSGSLESQWQVVAPLLQINERNSTAGLITMCGRVDLTNGPRFD